MKKFLLVVVLIGVGYYTWPGFEVHHDPGQVAPHPPVQTPARVQEPLEIGEYSIRPMAWFQVTARVLGKEPYHFGREADLSPVDLALGWGPMSDSAVLEGLDIRQSARWFRWRPTGDWPIPRREIELHSANMHMIPADKQVARTLKRVRKGQVVEFRGWLVSVSAPDGWRWQSSLTREDTGARACELVWVDALNIVEL